MTTMEQKRKYNEGTIEETKNQKDRMYRIHRELEQLEEHFWLEKEYYIEYLPEEEFDKIGGMLEEAWLKLGDARDAILDATTIIEEAIEE